MNPPCARCSKTVYPTEKLNCLDKTWHKGCFKCQECNMTLNMKNYKGYNKLPYCNAHYPSTSFTAVADTPENRRLAKNTRNQSNAHYQAAFKESKGHYMAIPDDPEIMRNLKNTKRISLIEYHKDFEELKEKGYTVLAETAEMERVRKNQQIVSQIKYHEDFEKMKGTKTDVADDPETLRAMKNMRQMSDLEYKGHRQLSADMEARRGQGERDDVPQMPQMPQMPRAPAAPTNDFKSPYSARNQPGMSTSYTQQGKEPARGGQRVGSISDYDPMNDQWGSVTGQPYSGGQQFTETVAAPGQQRYQQPPGGRKKQGFGQPPAQPQPPAQQQSPAQGKGQRQQQQQQPQQQQAGKGPKKTALRGKGAQQQKSKEPEPEPQPEEPEEEAAREPRKFNSATFALWGGANPNLIKEPSPEPPPPEPEKKTKKQKENNLSWRTAKFAPKQEPQPEPQPQPQQQQQQQRRWGQKNAQQQQVQQQQPPPQQQQQPQFRQNQWSNRQQQQQQQQMMQQQQMLQQQQQQQQQQGSRYRGFRQQEPGYTGPPSGYTAPPSQPQQPPPSAGVGGRFFRKKPNLKFTAMYDYVAADDDEVSFVEGDIIVNAEIIDEGWMTGVVQRTGESGMLPSNYVEPM